MNTTLHNHKQLKALREFAEDILEFSDLKLAFISEKGIAKEYGARHLRGGKLTKDWTTDKQWLGSAVLAIAHDEDTVFVLTANLLRISL